MTHVTRMGILSSIGAQTRDSYSIVEIAGIVGVPENTAKSHFARSGFVPTGKLERNKRIYDKSTLMRYGIWLYMAAASDGPLGYSAAKRDEILSNSDITVLWCALEESVESFVRAVMLEYST